MLLAYFLRPAWAVDSPPVISTPAGSAFVATRIVHVAGTSSGGSVNVRVFEGSSTLADTGPITGAWAADIPFADGSHTITVQGQDAGGSWTSPSAARTFTVDTVAPSIPAITAPVDNALIAFQTFALEGTGEPGARIDVTLDGGSVLIAIAQPSGGWSIPHTFTDAPHVIQAVAVDRAGNRSLSSGSTHFTVDTMAPPAPRIDQPRADTLTNKNVLTVGGVAEPGSALVLSEGGPIASTIVNASSAWAFPLTFAEGPHQVSARATDPAGNVGPPSATLTFTVDTTAPDVPVIGLPVEGDVLAPGNVVVTGTAEPNSTVQILRNAIVSSSTVTNSSGEWSVRLTGLPNGSVSFTARAKDVAGNIGAASDPRAIIVDGVPPTITMDTADGAIFLPTETPLFKGTASDAHGVRSVILDFYDIAGRGVLSVTAACVLCPFANDVDWSNTNTPLLGKYVVRAYARDRAGNRSDFATVSVTIVRLQ